MFTVKKKPLTPNTIWDAKMNRPLCKFDKGVFLTNNQEVANKLIALGYEVTGEIDKSCVDGKTIVQTDNTDSIEDEIAVQEITGSKSTRKGRK